MRLFVALEIPAQVQEAIATFLLEMKRACPEARWVRAGGIHITLKFIGEAGEEKRRAIELALAGIEPVRPVRMSFRGTGFFPNAKHPRVFWSGIEATAALSELAGRVEEELSAIGIPKEQRPFQPHLTLARFDSSRGVAELQSALMGRSAIEFGETTAHEMFLFQSELMRGGARHTKLRAFPVATGNGQAEAAR